MRQTLNALGLCIGLGNILVTRPRSTLEGIAIKNEGVMFCGLMIRPLTSHKYTNKYNKIQK